MEKKNRISVRLDNTWEKPASSSAFNHPTEPSELGEPGLFYREWPLEEDPYTTPMLPTGPSLPFSHFQKRQRKQRKARSSVFSKSRGRGIGATGRMNRFSGLSSSAKLFFTIASAVGLGLVMGMMVLNIFSNLNVDQAPSSSTAHPQAGEPSLGQAGAPPMNSGEQLTLIPSGTVQGNQVHLPARTYYVVQAGAFSEKQVADESLQMHMQKGWAGILLGDEAPYRLYAGVASSKEEAMLLGQYYREEELDIYVKEHVTEAVSGVEVTVNGETLSKLPSFLAKGEELVKQMGSLSARGIMNPSTELAQKDWQQLQELHRSFLEEGKALFLNWPEQGKKEGEELLRQLTEAMNALDAYYKQKHPTYLWNVQQALLRYVEAYDQFMASFSRAH